MILTTGHALTVMMTDPTAITTVLNTLALSIGRLNRSGTFPLSLM